jgi:hypothetical protein
MKCSIHSILFLFTFQITVLVRATFFSYQNLKFLFAHFKILILHELFSFHWQKINPKLTQLTE